MCDRLALKKLYAFIQGFLQVTMYFVSGVDKKRKPKMIKLGVIAVLIFTVKSTCFAWMQWQ